MSSRRVGTSPLVILALLVAGPGQTQPLAVPVIEVPPETPAVPAVSGAWEPRSRHAAASLDPAAWDVAPAAVIDVPHDTALARAIKAMAPNQIGVARPVAREQVDLLRERRFPWTRLPSGGQVAVLHLGGEVYAVSLIQSDETLGMITFAADGTRLGKGVGGSTRNPRVAAGLFPQTAPSQGLVVSLLQADNLPASISFSVTGTRLGKGVAPLQAVAADVDTADINGDGYAEEVMAFTDRFGFARWAIFASDGTTLLRSE